MITRTKINEVLHSQNAGNTILVKGWVRTRRDSKDFSFIEVNDGSCLKNLQVVAESTLTNYDDVRKLGTGSAISVIGEIVESPGKEQRWELKAKIVDIISHAPESFPLQKKRHTDEFLRTIAHLRPRTNKYGAVFRIRSELSFAVHQFFRDRGFRYIHTPIITGSDCEGAGELFQVTTQHSTFASSKDQTSDSRMDFFGKKAYLTVSGQLSAEMFALSLGDVYTFGPTFRAENSNTRRHAAEFWMIEPEMAFCDLEGNMEVGEALIKYLVSFVLKECPDDIDLFAKFVDKTLIQRLNVISESEYARVPYKDAIQLLQKSGKKFENNAEFGNDLQSEHEQFLTDDYFKKPVIIYNYPKSIKPFYMRVNQDGVTVAGMDVLVPGIGELIGGSQREERLDVLIDRMKELRLPESDYWWYIDSRKYGSVPHSGFGLGFERLIMMITGVSNIRDVIPFPRTPGNIDF